VEVQRWSLFQSTSLGKRRTSSTPHPFLKNVLQTVDHFEISCHKALFSWLEKVDQWNPIRTSTNSPDLTQCDFWAFPNMERELQSKKFRSDQQSAARFQEVGGVL
jgi:hypothetical protein